MLYFVFWRRGLRDEKDICYFDCCSAGDFSVFVFAFIYVRSVAKDVLRHNYLSAWLGSLLIANPYPGVAYLSYGF